MRVASERQRGQATVEFALFSVFLVLSLVLVIQFAWIGVQKWQFNHFAGYAARTWSVHHGKAPSWWMNRIIVSGAAPVVGRWKTITNEYVALIWFSGEEGRTVNNGFEDVDVHGLTYTGIAPLMAIFRPFIGSKTLVDLPPGLQSVLNLLDVDLPPLGLVRFEVFIPMVQEPREYPYADGQKQDNDCYETPCEEGNGR